MSTRFPRWHRDLRRSHRPLLLLLLLIPALALFVGLLARPSATPQDDPTAVRAYQDQLHEVAARGGRVIVAEVQPALSDLVHGRLTPQKFIEQSSSWLRELQGVKQSAGALRVPPGLEHAAALFDAALGQYEQAVSAFQRAATQANPIAAVRASVPLGDHADATYDQFIGALRQALQTLHQPMISWGLPQAGGGG